MVKQVSCGGCFSFCLSELYCFGNNKYGLGDYTNYNSHKK